MPNEPLTLAITLLTEAIGAITSDLRGGVATKDAVKCKHALQRGIRVLELAEALGISGHEVPTVMPMGRTRTPSSEFRVLEDHETDDQSCWTEVEVKGDPLRLHPGDIVLVQRPERTARF